jgi:ABC-2 type transport system ATP-binding protein
MATTSAAQKEPIIRLNKVTVRYGSYTVFEDTSLDIYQGDLFGIVGLSGSGKTTLLNTIIGVVVPQEGEILFRMEEKAKPKKGGKADEKTLISYKPLSKNLLTIRKIFGFAAQEPSFYPKLTLRENLEYFASMYDLKDNVRKNNIKTVLELVNLEAFSDLLSDQLSGGMKKRLDIACALIQNPDVLILDEPTSDLDPLLRMQMWDLIKKINKNGTTIIISSHFLNEMEKLCTRIGIINQKKIDLVGTMDYIKDKYSRDEEIHIETIPGNYDEIVRQLNRAGGINISNVLNKGHELVVCTRNTVDTMSALLAIIKRQKEHLVDITVTRPSLAEVFESLLREKKNG